MKRYAEHCDLCQIEIGKETNNGKHGFCSEIGFSLGGWGFRQNFIEKRSIEVCTKCFEQLKEKSIALSDTIKELKK